MIVLLVLMYVSWHRISETGRCQLIYLFVTRKRTAVPGWLDPDDGVSNREYAEEQHHQEQRQVKIIGP